MKPDKTEGIFQGSLYIKNGVAMTDGTYQKATVSTAGRLRDNDMALVNSGG